jgi:hypothetical protein
MYPFMNVHVTTKKVYNLESGLSIETTINKNTRYDFFFLIVFVHFNFGRARTSKLDRGYVDGGLE